MPGKDQRNARSSAAAILVALGLDALGEPPAVWHPVVWFGKLIRWLEGFAPRGRGAQLVYGGMMLALAAPCAFVPAWLWHRLAVRVRDTLCERGSDIAGLTLFALLEGAGLKPFFSLSMLIRAGRAVRLALQEDNIVEARASLSHLVSRERSQLNAEEAGAAAIESLAENLSDSVVAPLFFYGLLGLPGAAAYRLFNTFDSMIGYHGHYEYLGKAAAHLDDLLNLLPARLTALLIIGAAPLFGGERHNAWRIWRRDARKTASPAAGQPMAAAAGALRVSLVKIDHYRLGESTRPVTPQRIRQAERMVWTIGLVFSGMVALTQLVRGDGGRCKM